MHSPISACVNIIHIAISSGSSFSKPTFLSYIAPIKHPHLSAPYSSTGFKSLVFIPLLVLAIRASANTLRTLKPTREPISTTSYGEHTVHHSPISAFPDLSISISIVITDPFRKTKPKINLQPFRLPFIPLCAQNLEKKNSLLF